MYIYTAIIALICLSAGFAYINQKVIKLPFVIGLFLLSTGVSLVVISSKLWLGASLENIRAYVAFAHIDRVVLEILLGFLLFAGAMHTNWESIKRQFRTISTFAFAGVLASTLLIATMLAWVAQLLGLNLPFIHCLLFGALISPTDPIAVLGILTKANVPKKTEAIIVGESLFNDGVGVVVFIALLETLKSGRFDLGHFGVLFAQEAVGGVVLGLGMGYALHLLLKSIDHYETEVLLTLAFVMGGYFLCSQLHTSGPLAMVVMGLMVGNFRPNLAMSDTTQAYVHKFWELVDVILNAILFILIAFVIILVDFNSTYLAIGAASVVIVLLSRAIVVYIPHWLVPRFLKLDNKQAKIITWGGLRGGLSLALVLSLPESEAKDILLFATYFCVLFSILVQGLTIGRLARKLADSE